MRLLYGLESWDHVLKAAESPVSPPSLVAAFGACTEGEAQTPTVEELTARLALARLTWESSEYIEH